MAGLTGVDEAALGLTGTAGAVKALELMMVVPDEALAKRIFIP